MSDDRLGHNGGPAMEETPWGRDGYVKISRASRDHPIVGFGKSVQPADDARGFCYSRAEAWQDLIMECRYSPGEVINKGKKMEIKPGQLLGAISWLAHRWNWTPKTVRWFLDQLQADHMITRSEVGNDGLLTENKGSSDENFSQSERGNQSGKRNGNRIGMLSICNYEIYQIAMHVQRQAKGQPQWQPNGNPTASQRQANGNTLRKEEGKKEERIQLAQQQDAAREDAAAALVTIDATNPLTIDSVALTRSLMAVCRDALDDPVNCSGLLTAATPIVWLRQGCDYELDVVETLKAMGIKHRGKRISTWDYFTKAVYAARDKRLEAERRGQQRPPSLMDRQKHWIENTEPGRAKVRELGRQGAERYYAEHLANERLTPDGYTLAEIERRDEEAYAKRAQQQWCRA